MGNNIKNFMFWVVMCIWLIPAAVSADESNGKSMPSELDLTSVVTTDMPLVSVNGTKYDDAYISIGSSLIIIHNPNLNGSSMIPLQSVSFLNKKKVRFHLRTVDGGNITFETESTIIANKIFSLIQVAY